MSEYVSCLFHCDAILGWLKDRPRWDQGNGIEVANYDDLASDLDNEFAVTNRRPNQTRLWAMFKPTGEIIVDSIATSKEASLSKVLKGEPYLTVARFWADWEGLRKTGWSCRQIEWVVVEEAATNE